LKIRRHTTARRTDAIAATRRYRSRRGHEVAVSIASEGADSRIHVRRTAECFTPATPQASKSRGGRNTGRRG